MKSIVGCDMDGVIADFVSFAIDKVNKRWSLDIKQEELLRPRLGREVTKRLEMRGIIKDPEEVYDYLSFYNIFENLDVIEGAQEAIKEIAVDNKVVFITKALEWDRCPGEKKRWLDKHFSDIDYSFAIVDRFEDKGLFDLDFMIDDDPRTLAALKTTVPLAVEQPWNQEYLTNNPSMIRIASIRDAPKTIKYFQQNIFCF